MIQKQKSEIEAGERKKLYLEIAEMWCPSCAEIIKLIISKEKGVMSCVIDYSTDLAAIEYSPRYLSQENIIDLIKKLGYRPILPDSAERSAVSKDLIFALELLLFAH